MKTLDIPLNKHLQFKNAGGTNDYVFSMNPDERHLNHLGTVHASALYAMAEATSGEFLLNEFKENLHEVIPVVRNAEIKYSKPANGEIKSKASLLNSSRSDVLKELNDKKRTIAKVRICLFNEKDEKVLHSVFDWFILKK